MFFLVFSCHTLVAKPATQKKPIYEKKLLVSYLHHSIFTFIIQNHFNSLHWECAVCTNNYGQTFCRYRTKEKRKILLRAKLSITYTMYNKKAIIMDEIFERCEEKREKINWYPIRHVATQKWLNLFFSFYLTKKSFVVGCDFDVFREY